MTSVGGSYQKHNSVPRRIESFNNTVVAGNTGISITSADPAYPQRVIGNAVFAGSPLTGGQQSNNMTGTYAAASTYLNNPMAALGSGLDLYPKSGQLQGTAIDRTFLSSRWRSSRKRSARSSRSGPSPLPLSRPLPPALTGRGKARQSTKFPLVFLPPALKMPRFSPLWGGAKRHPELSR